MPTFNVKAPDGSIIPVNAPDGATEQQAIEFAAKTWKPSMAAQVDADPISQGARNFNSDSGFLNNMAAGSGKFVNDLGLGIRQITGNASQQEVDESKQRDAALMSSGGGRAGNLLTGAGLAAATALIPGANGIVGGAVLGGLQAGLEPTATGESRVKNAVVGSTLGAGGQAFGSTVGNVLTNRLASQATAGTAAVSRNSVRDATLGAAQDAGYVVPPSTVNPSWINRRLESISGKAATGQAAAAQNQDVTNALARKALGLSPDTPLSEATLNQFRDTASAPYREVAALPAMPPQRTTGIGGYPLIGPAQQAPADALRDLQQARFDANAYWNEFRRTGEVAARDKATALSTQASGLEDYLEKTAMAAGKPDLVNSLRAARQAIAKSYTVQNALNTSTGNVVGTDLSKALNRGVPLNGDLETAGRFADAYPQFAREGTKIPPAGVSKSEAILATLLGAGGAASAGPIGIAAGALPLLSDPVRNVILSKAYQGLMATPKYGPGMVTQGLGQIGPQRGSVIGRALLAPLATQ